MKKSLTIITALACFIFADCHLYAFETVKTAAGVNTGVTAENPFQTTPKKAAKPAPKKAAPGKGENLISKSDCLACHKLDVKVIGPAYYDVAKKYPATPANIDMLAAKVIAGGTGVWGQLPMTPHPQVSTADAKEMVKYILALKAK